MAKPSSSFKLRLSRVFPSFHSCRSKSPSTVPAVLRFLLNPTPSSKPHGSSSFRRHVSSSIPCGRSCGSSGALLSDEDHMVFRSQRDCYSWKKEEQWHVVARIKDDNVDDEEETPRKKIYNTSASAGDEDTDENDDDVLVLPPLTMQRRTKRRSKHRKRTTAGSKLLLMRRLSTSSADSSGLFSNDDDEGQEFDTLVTSSRSFSTETSSDAVNPRLEPISEKKPKKKKKKRATKLVSVCVTPESGGASPARLSVFKKLIPCAVDGKVRESYAVVKKSENPYEDFKRSMMEMIMEKKMSEDKELEQLLHCFLSLNARDHHGVIVEAFTDIWELIFRKNWSESDA